MIDLNKIRENTLSILDKKNIRLGYELPLLDIPEQIRSKEEIASRIDTLHFLYAIYLKGKGSKKFFYKIVNLQHKVYHFI